MMYKSVAILAICTFVLFDFCFHDVSASRKCGLDWNQTHIDLDLQWPWILHVWVLNTWVWHKLYHIWLLIEFQLFRKHQVFQEDMALLNNVTYSKKEKGLLRYITNSTTLFSSQKRLFFMKILSYTTSWFPTWVIDFLQKSWISFQKHCCVMIYRFAPLGVTEHMVRHMVLGEAPKEM